MPANLLACSVALVVYCILAARWERLHPDVPAVATPTEGAGETMDRAATVSPTVSPSSSHGLRHGSEETSASAAMPPQFRINLAKASVPFVPLLLLFGAARVPLLRPFHDHVTILAAMLIGCLTAAAASPRQTGRLAASFFEGTGFAYTHVISVTVCATLFAQGIIANGLVQRLVSGLSGRPGPALFASLTLPWGLAALSGSGAGSATSMMTALIPGARSLHLDPGQMGILTAMGSHFGRTMSPAAAVAILCATLVSAPDVSIRDLGERTLGLTRRVAPALLVGGLALYIAALFGLAR